MTLEEILRKVAGTTGALIDKATDPFGWSKNTSFGGNKLIDLSATLQNWGGNKAGSGWGIVKPAYAADNTTSPKQKTGVIPDAWLDPENYGTDNSGGGTGGTVKVENKDNGENIDDKLRRIAEEERQARIKAAKAKLDKIKERVQGMKDSAGRIKEQTLKTIKENYDQLKGLSITKKLSSLGELVREGTNVQNIYGKTAGNARRAMESANTRNRVLARAMGLGGSSFYKDAQDNTTNEGMNSINDSAEEEAAKLAAIEERKATTGKEYDVNDVAIRGEEGTLNTNANENYNNAISNADLVLGTGYADDEEALSGIETDFGSKLTNIAEYLKNLGLAGTSSTTQAREGAGATWLKNWQTKDDNLNNTLQDNSGVNRVGNYIATAKDTNPYGNTGVTNPVGASNLTAIADTAKAIPVWDALQGRYVYKKQNNSYNA